jgi:hypothetical protein
MVKNWLKKITGLAEIQAAAQAAELRRIEEEAALAQLKEQTTAALETAQKAIEDAQLLKLSEKERATKKGEAWVSVLDTKVNPENIRNGFFELDWNELFVKELIMNGYGTEADPEEEIVDRWFREIVYNMFADEGLDTTRGSGYINVVPISKGKSEVS